jgi:hypothetical protein
MSSDAGTSQLADVRVREEGVLHDPGERGQQHDLSAWSQHPSTFLWRAIVHVSITTRVSRTRMYTHTHQGGKRAYQQHLRIESSVVIL